MRWFGWFRQDPRKDDIDKTAKAYEKIMDFSKADKTKLTDSDKQSNTFLDTNSDIINSYIKNFGNTKSDDQRIDNLLKAFYNRYPDKKPMPPLERRNAISQEGDSGEKKEELKKQKEKEENEKNAKKSSQEDRDKLDAELGEVLADTDLNLESDDSQEDHDNLTKGINPSAKKGLRDISCWMLRNGVKTGAFGDGKVRFVMKGVLNEDARIKLFAYYLVEHGMQGESNPDSLKMALSESQTNYKPNLAAFKDKVIASKFKFWKRLNASHFYWEKISVAIRLAIKNRNFMKPFGTLGGNEVSSSDMNDTDGEEQTQENTPDTNATKTNAANNDAQAKKNQVANDPKTAQLAKAAKEREQKLSNYVEAGKELMRMRKELSEDPHTDEMNKKAYINTQIAALSMLFEDLKDSDINVKNVFETLDNNSIQDAPEKEEEKSTAEKLGEAAETVNGLIGYTEKPKNLMEHYNNLAKAGNGMNPAWNIAEIPEDAVKYMDNLGATSDVLSIAGSALSCFNLVLKLVKIKEDKATMTAGTLAMEGMDAFSEALGIASSLTSTIQGLLGVGESVASATSGVFSAVSGLVNVISAAVTMDAMEEQQRDLKTAKKKLKGDSKAEKMIRLGERTTSIRANHAAAKFIAGEIEIVGGVLSATGVAAVAGAALGTVGAIIELTSDVVSYFQNRQNMRDTIDDYINMDKMMGIITSKSKDKSSMQTEEVKDQLREEMVARLHFSSIDELYESIIEEYATYIHNHIFFDKGDLSKPLDSKVKENEGYIDLLKGFGAEPDFSTGKPGIKSIAEYLKKV